MILDRDILRWFLFDFVSQPVPRRLVAAIVFIMHSAYNLVGKKGRAVSLLMTAHRLHPCDMYTKACEQACPAISSNFASMMSDDVSLDAAVGRSIILRMPELKEGSVRKGVLLITFTDTNRYYFHHLNIALLQKYFHVVLEPSWAGYCLPEILFWETGGSPVFVQATEVLDRQFLSAISDKLIPLTFGASDWVNYNKFYPVNCEKTYDSIYVANYTYIKRLHVYFRAIKKIKKIDAGYRAAIVCASWGENRAAVFKLIEYYHIADVLEVKEDLNAAELNQILNQSRCNILLSLKEGSNRSLFEAMFSDVPVIALKNNVGMNKDYINQSTGMLIEEHMLASTLLKIKQIYNKFEARKWAMTNISPEITTAKLHKAIARYEGKGELSGNLMVKTNDPEVAYFQNTRTDKNYYVREVLALFDVAKIGDIESELQQISEAFSREC